MSLLFSIQGGRADRQVFKPLYFGGAGPTRYNLKQEHFRGSRRKRRHRHQAAPPSTVRTPAMLGRSWGQILLGNCTPLRASSRALKGDVSRNSAKIGIAATCETNCEKVLSRPLGICIHLDARNNTRAACKHVCGSFHAVCVCAW